MRGGVGIITIGVGVNSGLGGVGGGGTPGITSGVGVINSYHMNIDYTWMILGSTDIDFESGNVPIVAWVELISANIDQLLGG